MVATTAVVEEATKVEGEATKEVVVTKEEGLEAMAVEEEDTAVAKVRIEFSLLMDSISYRLISQVAMVEVATKQSLA